MNLEVPVRLASHLKAVGCSACGSIRRQKLESEITIHFPKLIDIDKRPVVVVAELRVCGNCGKADFVVPNEKLAQLVERKVVNQD
jgi:hypothetical protein